MLQRLLLLIGFGLCHQLPQRSFFGGGIQAPVCARDTGIFFGFAISALLIYALDGRPATELPRRSVLIVAAIFFGTMVWDGVTSYSGLRPTTNDIRLITGLLSGFAIPVVFVPFLNGELLGSYVGGRSLEGSWRPAVWVAAVPFAFVAIRYGMPLLGVWYPVAVAGVVVATLTVVNVGLCAALWHQWDWLRTRGRIAALVATSLALTVFELVGSAGIKLLVFTLVR